MYVFMYVCMYVRIMNHNSGTKKVIVDEEGYGGEPQKKFSHSFPRWQWGSIG